MYLRIGDRTVNTDNIVEATVSPGTPAGIDGDAVEEYQATATSVEIVTTAVELRHDDGEYFFKDTRLGVRPHNITLAGPDAEKFLQALPTYEPMGGE